MILLGAVVMCTSFTSCSGSKSTAKTTSNTQTTTRTSGGQVSLDSFVKKNGGSTAVVEEKDDEKAIETVNGKASYYADKYQGRPTANGESFDQKAFTCAHKTYKFGTMLRVTNLANNKSVKVRVNDRGPYVKGRIVDLTRAAAEKIDMVNAGVADVKVEVLSIP